MVEQKSLGRRLFVAWNYGFLAFLSFICLFPILHVLALSLSERAAVSGGMVVLLPIGFNLDSYQAVLTDSKFIASFFTSVMRVIAGTSLNMLLIVLTAFPLIKRFKGRNLFVWFMVFTMLFNGGMIPTYLVIKELQLLNSFWVLILPLALPVFSVILMMNFFKAIPKEMDEAAAIDGASNFQILFRIYVPMSMAAIATLTLFSAVMHWNSFFDAILYMNRLELFPLQAYLQSQQIDEKMLILQGRTSELAETTNRSLRAAQVFISTLPILLVYPFLQKHFVKGIVIGSVKE